MLLDTDVLLDILRNHPPCEWKRLRPGSPNYVLLVHFVPKVQCPLNPKHVPAWEHISLLDFGTAGGNRSFAERLPQSFARLGAQAESLGTRAAA
jgi:hypothetical protein